MLAYLIAISVLVFAIGSVFGSFITALVYRQKSRIPISRGRSVCPHCGHQLSLPDLFPILSYLLLRGKCRHCHQSISPQYVIIELFTAMLFVSIFLIIWLQASPVGLGSSDFYWLLFSLLIGWSSAVLMMALFVYDYRWGQLPNRWTLMLATIALLATIAALALRQPLLWQPGAPQATLDTIWLTLLSGFGAGLFFLAVIVGSELILKKPGMGLGDAKLAVGLGLLLGFPGIIVGLYLAFVFGSVLSLLLIAGKRKKLGNSIPFGPFMIGGALIAMWLTSPIANWYTNLLF